jgi:hypothetical protein
MKKTLGVFAAIGVMALVACSGHTAPSGAVSASGGTVTAGNATTATTTASAATTASSTSTVGGSTAVAAAPGDFGPMRTVEIWDPIFNMVAYTISIPKSWNFEGTVLHGPGCQFAMAAAVLRAYSPDLSYGIQTIPVSDFFWADDQRALPQGPNCKILQQMSAEDYGRLITVSIRPGSVVDSVEPAPGEASYLAGIEKSNQAVAAQAASVGNRNPSHATGQARWLHIHYDLNGHREEEILNVAMSVSDQPTSVMVNRPGQVLQTAIKHRYDSTPYVNGFRAPQGQLQSHIDAFKAINSSFKVNPEYSAKYTAYMQDLTNKSIAASWKVINSILAQGRAEQAQRTQQAQDFIANMQKQGDARNAQFNANMAAKDAHTKDVVDYILDQQLYVNPTTGKTQTQSNQYDHTFSNGSGPGSVVLQTNSPTYNPNGQLQGNWTELQPIHH